MEKPYGRSFYTTIAAMLGVVLLPCFCLSAWGADLLDTLAPAESKPVAASNGGFAVVAVYWVLGSLLSLALLAYWMIVAWWAMQALERSARAGERTAAALEALARLRGAGAPGSPPVP